MSVAVNIKAIDLPFPLFSNPLKQACDVQFNEWVQRITASSTEKDKKFFSDLGIVAFVCESYPTASLATILFTAKVGALGAYVDDFFDDRCGIEGIMETIDRFKAFERGEKLEP
ncbi:hypothetical protein B4U80_12541, partial [Leptotrombidium deliense]